MACYCKTLSNSPIKPLNRPMSPEIAPINRAAICEYTLFIALCPGAGN